MPQIRPEQIIDTSQDSGLSRYNPPSEPVRKQTVTPSTNLDSNARFAGYKFNVVKDKEDKRDYIFTAVAPKASSTVDMRKWAGIIEDQGALGSCTAQAISSAVEIILTQQKRMTEISRLFIYYNTRLLEGTVNYDSGAYLRDGIKSCYTWGAAKESVWPYNTRQYTVRPPLNAYNDAVKYKLTQYQRVLDFNGVKNALALNYPVVAGFLVYSSFLGSGVASNGMMPVPNPKREQLLGGHAIVIVGYNDARKVFICKNSWGPKWGDKGYFYMPYAVMQNPQMVSDMWLIAGIYK